MEVVLKTNSKKRKTNKSDPEKPIKNEVSKLIGMGIHASVLSSIWQREYDEIKSEQNVRVIFRCSLRDVCDLYVFPISELSDKDYEMLLLLNTPILSKYSNARIGKILKAGVEFFVAIGEDVEYAPNCGMRFLHKKGVWKQYKVDENNPARKGETCMYSVFNNDAMTSWLTSNKSRIGL